MRIPIFTKIFGGCVLIIITLSLLIPFFTFKAIRTHYINTYTENLKNLAVILKPEISLFIHKHNFKDLDAYAKSLKSEIPTRITVIDKEGAVIADSEKDPKTMENHKIRSEVVEALSGNVGQARRFSVTVEEEMLYVAIPLEKGNRTIGVIRISAFLKDINNLLSALKIKIFWMTFVVSLLSLVFSLIISKSISNPLKKLVRAARSLSRGEFNTRIFLQESDELKELADSFNDMSSKMQNLFTELVTHSEELKTIISSIKELLLVFDKDGKIILINESFKSLIKNENPEGKFYWEIIRWPEFGELAKKVKTEKEHVTGEARFNEKTFLCSMTFLASKEETIAVLHDITDIKNLEKIKKDFIANISHEMRTPLTAIKGFVETMEEEEATTNLHYLEIIKRHTDRLIHIIGDLLLLSEIEEKGVEVQQGAVVLKNLIENILKMFEQRVNKKGLTISLHITKEIPPIKADSFKLEQMFINLIDNAIKYTEKGGVNISLDYSHPYVKIMIEDTGIGIPAEHLPRIFERFYVVDKSRSKKLGGTGLGLSIVKHIVFLHNGQIEVKSVLGKGTTFTILLSAN